MRKIPILFLSLVSVAGLVPELAASQNPPDTPSRANGPTRSCTAPLPMTKSGEGATHSTEENASDALKALPGCVEVRAKPQDIQEFLRSMTREQRWRTAQEQFTSDSWSFVRYLEARELQSLAKTDILGGRIVWAEGKAAVQVKTSDAGDGFTRVQVTAKFQGKGESKNQFARPTDIWPLASRGTLEGGMVAALESRFIAPR
jgi:hypothetical protein